MTRIEKIIIGIMAVVFLGGVGGALHYFSQYGGGLINGKETSLSPQETSLSVNLEEDVLPKEEFISPEVPPQDQGKSAILSKSDAERMLQETENDFRDIDIDLSAQ